MTGKISAPSKGQGCQMVYFQTKNRNLGKFGKWNGKCRCILLSFVIFYGHLVNFMATW
jgi:hypothetical protein